MYNLKKILFVLIEYIINEDASHINMHFDVIVSAHSIVRTHCDVTDDVHSNIITIMVSQ